MNAWRRWVALIDRREDATSLAICRIVAGATILQSLVEVWIRGVAAAGWVEARFGGMRNLEGCWLRPVGGCTPGAVHTVLALAIAASALVTVGALTPWSTVFLWITFRFLTGLNVELRDGSDRLLVNILFVLMLSGAGRALSVDARFRGKGGDAPAWPRWVLVAQLVLMYFSTALQKVSSGWLPGGPLDAVWFIVQQPTWQRGSMKWLAPYYPITQAATLGTWLFETTSPLFAIVLWLRATRERPGRLRAIVNRYDIRSIYLAGGLVMHLGITAALAINQFLGGVLALYACCYGPDEWRALGARVARAIQRVRERKRSAA